MRLTNLYKAALIVAALIFLVAAYAESHAQSAPSRERFRGRKDAPSHCNLPDQGFTDWQFSDEIKPQFLGKEISIGSSVVIEGSFPGLVNEFFFNDSQVTSSQGVTVYVDDGCYPQARLQYLSKEVIVFEYPRNRKPTSGKSTFYIVLNGVGLVKTYRNIPVSAISPSFNMPSGNTSALNAANGLIYLYDIQSGTLQWIDAVSENRPIFNLAKENQNALLRYTVNGSYGAKQVTCWFDDIPCECTLDWSSTSNPVGVQSLFVIVPLQLRHSGVSNFMFYVDSIPASNKAVVLFN